MGVRPRRRLGAPLKREVAAALVRERIADGTLKPGAAAPSAAALARETGYSTLTCRAALETLVKEGTLARGVSPTARLRVGRVGRVGVGRTDAEAMRTALSKALAARRRAGGLTQPELAAKLAVSVTTVGHAETGRVWQSREFWQRAAALLDEYGDLLRMFDDFQAAKHAAPEEIPEDTPPPEQAFPAAPVLPVSITITSTGVAVVWPDGSETIAAPPPKPVAT
jgi:DNA-binding transcriptional regulator YhcF (GntR family)